LSNRWAKESISKEIAYGYSIYDIEVKKNTKMTNAVKFEIKREYR
jgi:hypothetical protein